MDGLPSPRWRRFTPSRKASKRYRTRMRRGQDSRLYHSDMKYEADAARLYFANVDEFVRLYLLPNWRRNPLHARWCSTWWEHAEAITRLEALWESWERHRLEPGTGMAIWWRDYADPHMAALTDRDTGPLFKCDATKGRHEVPAMWTAHLPPEGLFHDANLES